MTVRVKRPKAAQALAADGRVPAIAVRLYPLFLALLPTLGIAFPLLQPGFPIYLDNPFHMAQSYAMVEEMFPGTRWVSGWGTYIFAGLPVSLYYSQVGFWLSSLLYFFGISMEAAYKLVLIGAYAFPGWALYKLLAPRFGWKAASLSTLLWLFQEPAVAGMTSVFGGMWNQSIGIGFLLLFIDKVDSLYRRFSVARAAGASVLFGVTVLSHLIPAVAAGLIFAIYGLMAVVRPVRRLSSQRLLVWIAIPAIGSGVAAFHLLPVAEAGRWVPNLYPASNSTTIQQSLFMLFLPAGQILRETPGLVTTALELYIRGDMGEFILFAVKVLFSNLPGVLLAMFSILGLASLISIRKRRRNRGTLLATVMMSFSAASLVVVTGLYTMIPVFGSSDLASMVHSPRFIIFVRLGLIVLVAMAVRRIVRSRRGRQAYIFGLLTFVVLGGAGLGLSYSLGSRGSLATSSAASSMEDVEGIWQWVKDNVDGSMTRVYYQDTYQNRPRGDHLNSSHVFALSSHYTGADAIGPDYEYPLYPTGAILSSGSGRVFSKSIEQASPEFIAGRMRTFNAQYIVSVEQKMARMLESSADFQVVASAGDFTAFRLQGYDPSWAVLESGSGVAEVRSDGPERIVVNVSNLNEDTTLLVKHAYHPYWRAWVNGRATAVEMTDDFLIRVPVSRGHESEVTLSYSAFNFPAAMISLLSLAVAAGLFALGIVRRPVFPPRG